MNFDNMPELRTENGYYVVWAIMGAIGLGMFLWFVRLGWIGRQK
jgi:magnesium transporter